MGFFWEKILGKNFLRFGKKFFQVFVCQTTYNFGGAKEKKKTWWTVFEPWNKIIFSFPAPSLAREKN